MCTVTFLPLPGGGYLLGTNRDERPSRGTARPPEERVLAGRKLLHPVDSDAGGTWIAVDDGGRTLCILNGDREPAAPPPDDPPSRGILVLELMHDARPEAVLARLDDDARRGRLRQRAFKLVVAEPGLDARPASSRCITWDGRELRVEEEPGARLVVSSTYETDAVTDFRARRFAKLLASFDDELSPGTLARQLAAWHAAHRPEAPGGDAYSVCMHRDDASTVSSTFVGVDGASVTLSYRAGAPCRAQPVIRRELARSGSTATR